MANATSFIIKIVESSLETFEHSLTRINLSLDTYFCQNKKLLIGIASNTVLGFSFSLWLGLDYSG